MAVVLVFAARLTQASTFQPISIVSIPGSPPSGGSSDSFSPILSPDGRYVAFASLANNLALLNVPNPGPPRVPPVLNVFLRDRLSQTTKLATVSADGTGGGNFDSIPRGISTNGQFALFESAANNLVVGDANEATDIFVRDVLNNVTLLVSANTNGAVANGISRSAEMTPDGRYVTFVSSANDLVAGDANGIADVFVRDLQTSTTVLASVGAQSITGGSSEIPVITPQGRYVAFYSTATNLVTGITNTGEIFVRDLVAGTTVWASTNSHAIMQTLVNSSNAVCSNHEISDDGQFVAYEAVPFASVGGSPSWSRGVLLRHRMATGVTDIVNTNIVGIAAGSELTAHNLSLTPDGRFIAFIANFYGTNGATTAASVWDGLSNTTTVASVDLSLIVRTNSNCDSPVITPDGRFVAFWCNTNLTATTFTNGFHLFVRDLQTATTTLVDANTNGTVTATITMATPQVSADGSTVVFEAWDGGMVANDNNRAYDVFGRNIPANTTEIISVGLPGLPSLTPNGSCTITSSCVSTNGRFVAFASEANNLTHGDTNRFRDVYVRDLVAQSNVLVSVNTNGMAGNGLSTDAAISSDGRFVVFASTSGDLVANDTTNAADIFLRDLQSGTTTMVSKNSSGNGSGNNTSYAPYVSDGGQHVLFFSRAGNLVSGNVSNVNGNLFWRDLLAGTNLALTMFPPTSATTFTSLAAAMTSDGSRVAFGYVSNGLTTRVFVWDATLNQNVYTNSATASALYKTTISPDGNRLVIHRQNQVMIIDLIANTQLAITNSTTRAASQFSADSRHVTYVASSNVVYLHDFLTASNEVVSDGANGDCDSPSISADGRFIAFRSAASNLVNGDTNNVPDIFIRDRLSGTTTLVTASPYGIRPGSGRSFGPMFSGAGQTLVWQSWANNLAGQDFNHWCDIYALESLATNAVNSQTPPTISSFGFTSLAGFGSSSVVPALTWITQTGSNYGVQFKNALTDPVWQNLSGSVWLLGNQGFMLDVDPNSTQRFYRVVQY